MTWTVADVMASPVVVVPEGAGFRQIVATLWDHGISGVPVVDGSGRVTGVVSESDLILREEFPDREVSSRWAGILAELNGQAAAAMVTSLRKAQAATARELMTSPAITAEAGTSLGEAARLMHGRRVKRLVVVDGESRPLGIVTRTDLLKVFLGKEKQPVGGGWPYEPAADVDEDVPRD